MHDSIHALNDSLAALESFIPSQEELMDYIPTEVEFLEMLKFAGLFAVIGILVGFLFRFVFGKRSNLNHSVSSAMGILFMLAVSVIIDTFDPYQLSQYLSPLPYVAFNGDYLMVFSFLSADFPAICAEIQSMLILAFLVNLLDTFIPKGKHVVSWYLLRFATVLLSMAAHFLVTWLIYMYLPISLTTYAPIVLLGVLILSFLLGAANLVIGAVATAVNPIFGLIYAFFFNNLIGKQISKAIVTTMILTVLAIVVETLGYSVVYIAGPYLGAYAPLLAALLVLWYLTGHIL